MLDETLPIGTEFAGQFRINGELGRGGMGVVYAATELFTDRKVALKVIASKYARNPAFVRRFQRELKTIAKLTHENIVRMYQAMETEAGDWYLVMEHLDGMNLRELLKQAPNGRLSVPHAAHIALQLADAIAVAHAAKTLHCDIKPENVFVGNKSHVWLLDFGLAKSAEVSGQTEEERPMGTLRYVPPEILHNLRPDSRADLYQIGLVFFEMLTGRSPYPIIDSPEVTPAQVQAAHLFADPTPLHELLPGAPARAEALIAKCLKRNREDRYATANELGDDLYALILDVLPANHPIAVKGARERADQADWSTTAAGSSEPQAAAASPLAPERTATLRPAPMVASVDHAPPWLPGPRASQPEIRAAAVESTASSHTPDGTLRMQPPGPQVLLSIVAGQDPARGPTETPEPTKPRAAGPDARATPAQASAAGKTAPLLTNDATPAPVVGPRRAAPLDAQAQDPSTDRDGRGRRAAAPLARNGAQPLSARAQLAMAIGAGFVMALIGALFTTRARPAMLPHPAEPGPIVSAPLPGSPTATGAPQSMGPSVASPQTPAPPPSASAPPHVPLPSPSSAPAPSSSVEPSIAPSPSTGANPLPVVPPAVPSVTSSTPRAAPLVPLVTRPQAPAPPPMPYVPPARTSTAVPLRPPSKLPSNPGQSSAAAPTAKKPRLPSNPKPRVPQQ